MEKLLKIIENNLQRSRTTKKLKYKVLCKIFKYIQFILPTQSFPENLDNKNIYVQVVIKLLKKKFSLKMLSWQEKVYQLHSLCTEFVWKILCKQVVCISSNFLNRKRYINGNFQRRKSCEGWRGSKASLPTSLELKTVSRSGAR